MGEKKPTNQPEVELLPASNSSLLHIVEAKPVSAKLYLSTYRYAEISITCLWCNWKKFKSSNVQREETTSEMEKWLCLMDQSVCLNTLALLRLWWLVTILRRADPQREMKWTLLWQCMGRGCRGGACKAWKRSATVQGRRHRSDKMLELTDSVIK